jgi:thiamine pyrophosphate-dependent acetolactate synthase large subunit-like protein
VALLAPPNLTIVVMDNGVYQITGGQKTATASAVDIVAIARGSGLAESHWASDETEFEALFDAALARPAPSFIALKIDGQPAVGQTPREPARLREEFMRGIGVKGARRD